MLHVLVRNGYTQENLFLGHMPIMKSFGTCNFLFGF